MVLVKHLQNQIGTLGPRAFLYCRDCDAHYSANAGDYWASASDDPLICSCGNPLVLATSTTKIKVIRS